MSERLTNSAGVLKKCEPTSCMEFDCSCNLVSDALDKLAHYEDLEEQGRLIELPCKVGDTVYFIKFAFSVAKSPITAEIVSIKIIDGEMIYTAITQENSIVRKFKSDAIGKTVFFTKSEAEAKLKEMSSSENPNK